jgi:hypothetical protein
MDLKLTRILPEKDVPCSLNWDVRQWAQPDGDGTVFMMENGPEVRVRESFDEILKMVANAKE